VWRPRLRILPVGLVALVISCSAEPRPTLVTVELSSPLRVGYEIEHLHVEARVGGRTLVKEPPFPLSGKDPRRLTLPAKLGFERLDGDAGPLTILFRMGNREVETVASRALEVPLLAGKTIPLSVELSWMCAQRACPRDKTCVPGLGCVGAAVSPEGRPVEARRGPACNCASLFPLCVGARWRYEVCEPRSGLCFQRE
jgi:hypothetical protein